MNETLPRFTYDDLPEDHAALRAAAAQPSLRDRLWQRVQFGTAAACAASALVFHGDERPASLVVGLAAWLDPPDLDALVTLATPAATDALTATVGASWLPSTQRVAAAEVLARMPPTTTSLAVLLEVAESSTSPVKSSVLSALDAQLRVARDDLPEKARALRTQIRAGLTAKGIKRQEIQRKVASGLLPPAAMIACADPEFFATLIPPIADDVRVPLVPVLLAVVRDANADVRKRTFSLFHGRWLVAARQPVSALARFRKLRGSEATVPSFAAEALAAMGAVSELITVVVSGGPATRPAALSALERLAKPGLAGIAADIVPEASATVEQSGDLPAAQRLRKLLPTG